MENENGQLSLFVWALANAIYEARLYGFGGCDEYYTEDSSLSNDWDFDSDSSESELDEPIDYD